MLKGEKKLKEKMGDLISWSIVFKGKLTVGFSFGSSGTHRLVVLIDCRCADGRFLLPVRGVTILNSHSVSSSEIRG
jgi:hypothetical protein